MKIGEKRAEIAQSITISRAPERIWQQHFSTLGEQPEIQRTDLARHVLESAGRWISLEGAPGMGRTTLLGQVADLFFEKQDWFHSVWTASQVREVYDFTKYQRSRDLRPIARWLEMRARSSASGYATILIDDFDLLVSAEQRQLLDEILIAVPTLKIITTSLGPVMPSAALCQRGISRITRIPAHELTFSREETSRLVEAVASRSTKAEVLRRPETLQRLYEATRGIPLGVTLSIDRMLSSDDWPERQFSQVMNLFYTDLLRAHLRSMDTQGISAIYSTFSLMPRFTNLHIIACFPDVTPEMLATFAASTALDGRLRMHAGEYTWAEGFLLAAKELNGMRVAARRELGTKLYQRNYAGGAFEQWFLAGDLARAEAMLRTRFLTVYETLPPETAADVCEIAPTELAAYPMIRVLQTLLDTRASIPELRQCVENLSILGARGGAAGLMALSVRAAVLARKGLAKLAYEQAEYVLREVADLMIEGSDETEAERRSVAEASLTAVLALFQIGTLPSMLAVLPRCFGSPFLRYRRNLAQHYLDIVRAEATERISLANTDLEHAYRALVFSDIECSREADLLLANDERFLEMVQSSIPVRHIGNTNAAKPGVSKYFATSRECVRLMTLGDQAGALEVAYRKDALDPHASLLQSMLLLVTGRVREVRDTLDAMGEGRGARVEAARTVLRACTLMRLGQVEAARAMLSRVQGLQETLLAQAFSIIPPEDAWQLAQIQPTVRPLVEVAVATGALGIGQHISGVRKYEALTEKELVVLSGLREGLNTREIAEQHFLSVNTVRTHVRSIGKKLDASGQGEMLRRAEELRIFQD